MINQPIFGTFDGVIDEKLCFVLMPFSQKFDEVFNDSIKKTVEKNKLKCVRADDIYTTNPIIEDIWNSINSARLIVSDLTGKNPNVFYETGIAHTLGKDVILLTQKLSDVPFDLRHLRVIVYEFTPRGVVKLEANLENAIKSIITKTVKVVTKAQVMASSPANNLLTEPMSLLKEKAVIKSGDNYLIYEIHVMKNSMMTGYVSSSDALEVALIDEKNKELFENTRIYRSKLVSDNILKYNFHFTSKKDEILYLLIQTAYKNEVNVDINLQLEPFFEQDKIIIWDEESVQTDDVPDSFYSFNATKDDVIQIDVEATGNYDLYVIKGYSSKYDPTSYPEKLHLEEDLRYSHLKIKCQDTGLYTMAIKRKTGERVKFKVLISTTHSTQILNNLK